ncbi:MAG: response regulator [Myxococcota bacterium]
MRPTVDFKDRLILVVDDDEHTRNLLRDLCESAGFRVVTADDGVEATEKITAQKPDLVLLDLMMPRRDGFAVLRWVRDDARYAELPVIILTAIGEMDGKIRGMELGADDYVTKPFKLIELQTRINSALTVREYRRRLMDAEEELSQFRALDPVTGAGTYSQLKASLDGELARSRRYGRPAACLMFGFDDYQALRYELGREASDQYLARAAQAINGCLRGADRLFRVDTDEFVILLPETDLPGARVVAERLSVVLRSVSADGPNGRVTVVARFGGAVFPHERVRTTEDLLREANQSFRGLQQKAGALIFDA